MEALSALDHLIQPFWGRGGDDESFLQGLYQKFCDKAL